MPAVEVVKKAKLRGLSISKAYVYTIRSNANRKAAGGSVGLVARRGRPPRAARSRGHLNGRIDQLAKKFVEEILGVLRGASLRG